MLAYFLEDGTTLFTAEYDTLRIEATDEGHEKCEIVARIQDEDSLEPFEPGLCLYEDRGVLLCRSGCGDMVEVLSEPGLREWRKPARSSQPNARSKVEGITLTDGRLLLVYKYIPIGRTPLNVAVHEDEEWDPCLEVAGDMPSASDVRPYIGSFDFDGSRDFYIALGWKLNWEWGNIAELELGEGEIVTYV